jgi:long-chain acyl-CoA synthetase
VSDENISKEIETINKNLSKIEKIKKFFVIKDQFTIENGLMTPTLKLKRYKIIEKYKSEIEKLY